MTDSSNDHHSDARINDPALSAEQVRILSLIHRDRESLNPGTVLTDSVIAESGALLQTHPAIAAMNREATSLDDADLSSRIFSSTVDLLPQPRTLPRQIVGPHHPVRRSRFTRRATLLLAASLALAFVVGGALLNNGVPQETSRIASGNEPPVGDIVPDITPIFIPISAGDDDLDEAINDATSLIAFSGMTLDDIEYDLEAIERILQE